MKSKSLFSLMFILVLSVVVSGCAGGCPNGDCGDSARVITKTIKYA